MADPIKFEQLGRAELEPMADQIATQYGIPTHVFKGLIEHESGWNPRAKNPKSSATGLGQHLDSTLKNMGYNPTGDANDPRYNPKLSLELAAKHLVDKYNATKNWKSAVNSYGENSEAYIRKVEQSVAKYYKQGQSSQEPGIAEKIVGFLGPKSAEAAEPPGIGKGQIKFEPLSPDEMPQKTTSPADSEKIAFTPLEKGSTEPLIGPMGEPIKSEKIKPKQADPLSEGVQIEDFTKPVTPEITESLKEKAINPELIPKETEEAVGPALKFGTTAAGTALGTIAGGPVGAVVGGTLGYATGSEIEKLYEQIHGRREPGPVVEEMKTVATEELPEGAKVALAGELAGPLGQKAIGLAGRVIKPIMGKMSGVGEAAIDLALKGGRAFTKALRGEISGEEVVETAQSALQSLRSQRAAAYQAELGNIRNIHQDLDMTPINTKLRDLMREYNIKTNPDGTLDTSRIAMGRKGQRDIESMIDTVWDWGSRPGDKTPIGLDTLKRQLDDFYSESSQARAFVASLRKRVKDTIVQNVPNYADMTKGYAEATKLIKDIESGLMLRKQGMTGRITADQTLRRLVSAMKDNFPLRRDLVNLLGSGSQEDIAGLVAGHAMSAPLPRGLAGTFMIPEALFAQFVNPKIWPVLIASSPRLQGEFLNLVGKGIAETSGVSVPLAKSFSYMMSEKKKLDRSPKRYRRGDPNIYGPDNVNLTEPGAPKQ